MASWTRACATDDIELDDMIRFDHGSQTFVVVRSPEDEFFAIDGVCSHEHVHLCGGGNGHGAGGGQERGCGRSAAWA